jgi:uncharacterized membrane protein
MVMGTAAYRRTEGPSRTPSLEAFVKILLLTVKGASFGWRKSIWQGYGMWLLLGLEFELAADIIRSVVSPTLLDLAELGAIAVIRTFLSYFLEKDLAAVDGEGEPRSYPPPAAT